jgi:hypothetical protein
VFVVVCSDPMRPLSVTIELLVPVDAVCSATMLPDAVDMLVDCTFSELVCADTVVCSDTTLLLMLTMVKLVAVDAVCSAPTLLLMVTMLELVVVEAVCSAPTLLLITTMLLDAVEMLVDCVLRVLVCDNVVA